jgi:hypothetical protein
MWYLGAVNLCQTDRACPTSNRRAKTRTKATRLLRQIELENDVLTDRLIEDALWENRLIFEDEQGKSELESHPGFEMVPGSSRPDVVSFYGAFGPKSINRHRLEAATEADDDRPSTVRHCLADGAERVPVVVICSTKSPRLEASRSEASFKSP